MAEQTSISICQNYIYVKSAGDRNLYEFQNAINECLEIYKTKNINKVLVDATERSRPINGLMAMQAASYIGEHVGSKLRFAILVNIVGESHKTFASLVKLNSSSIKYFSDKNMALEWLLH